MKLKLTSPFWTWLAFASAAGFIVWAVGLFVAVKWYQREVDHYVTRVSKLLRLERAVRELGAAPPERGGAFRAALAATLAHDADTEAAELHAILGRVEGLVAAATPAGANGSFTRALDELDAAVALSRAHLAELSRGLGRLWIQLHVLVFISCVLAMTAAGLSLVHRRDVLKRQQLAEALRAGEDRFRAFMDNSPALAWMKDDQGRYVYLSGAHQKRLGVSLDDWRGRTDLEIWPPEVARRFRDNDQAVLAANAPQEMVEASPDPQGGTRQWWVFKFPVPDASGKTFIGGVAVDITERVRGEHAQTALIDQLRTALKEIKTLRGLVPICAHCKKIRDDGGDWQHLEIYLHEHTGAEFSHGICPTCLDEHYGEARGLPTP